IALPGTSRAHAELGRALLELGRPAEALPSLKRAVDLDPGAWAVRLMLGNAYLRLGRTEEGEREVKLGREGWAKQDYGSSKVKYRSHLPFRSVCRMPLGHATSTVAATVSCAIPKNTVRSLAEP